MKSQNPSMATRFLHLGMVTTVTFQLLISLVMAEPDHKGGALGKMAFEAHEIVGLTALAIVLLHWVWLMIMQTSQMGGGISHLFPWFGRARHQVVIDISALLKGKLPGGAHRGGLAGLVHGLGLLVVTGIAITGGLLFVLFPESGEPGFLAEGFAEIHEGIALLVWMYWIGHGGVAILHHVCGHQNLINMFIFKREKKQANNRVGVKLHNTNIFQ